MNTALSVLFALLVFGAGVVAPRAFAQKPASKNSKQEALLNTDGEFAKASVAKGAAEAFAIPMPRVSCKWMQTGFEPAILTTAAVNSPTCLGPA